MQYNIQQQEKHWRKYWKKHKIYKFSKNTNKPIFSIDTPPPYVSASHLHAGHIMSYAQAEFIARYKRMSGFNVLYPMGFDDNGLPTERYVEKKYKIDKSKISRKNFIKKCLKETKIGIKNYKKLWQMLGISVDWSRTYSTINKYCRKVSQWSFIDLYEKNLIYNQSKPLHWCPFCQTSLAQADLEDKTEKSFLNYITFETESKNKVLIATTRPELLPACIALFYNPSDKRYANLKNNYAIVPIFNYKVPILSDKSVDKNFGTGIMMVCTFGDKEDIIKWEKYNLQTKNLITKQGLLSKLGGKYAGQNLDTARKNILSDLKDLGILKKQEEIEHTLKVHDRCGSPVEFILSKQWFVRLLDNKQKFLQKANEINWYPEFMKQNYIDWVENLQWDWSISRQRYYGVPFPVWHCKKCGNIILADKKSLPIDPTESKPPIKYCPKCKSSDIVAEKDVMDTWMTSSLTPTIINSQPASLRPQAFEIIRTWLFYTIVKSYYHYNEVPFYNIMISGHGLDETGKKISKSIGNYKDPIKVIEQYGADAMRYWATSGRLGANIRYSEKEIEKGKKTVIKLWNAGQFTLSHLQNFIPKKNFTPKNLIDIWALHKLQKAISKTTKYFEKYEYFNARKTIDTFFWSIFCDNYLEFVKYRLYEQKDANAKNTLYIIFKTILKLYAPILPFITEELWQKLDISKSITSIHISKWPKKSKKYIAQAKQLNQIKNFLYEIEKARKLKTKLQIPMGAELETYKLSKNLDSTQKQELKHIMRIKKYV